MTQYTRFVLLVGAGVTVASTAAFVRSRPASVTKEVE